MTEELRARASDDDHRRRARRPGDGRGVDADDAGPRSRRPGDAPAARGPARLGAGGGPPRASERRGRAGRRRGGCRKQPPGARTADSRTGNGAGGGALGARRGDRGGWIWCRRGRRDVAHRRGRHSQARGGPRPGARGRSATPASERPSTRRPKELGRASSADPAGDRRIEGSEPHSGEAARAAAVTEEVAARTAREAAQGAVVAAESTARALSDRLAGTRATAAAAVARHDDAKRALDAAEGALQSAARCAAAGRSATG